MTPCNIAPLLLLSLSPWWLVTASTVAAAPDSNIAAFLAASSVPATTAPAAAEGLLSNVLGDHMVYNVGAPIVVWGAAPPGTALSVLLQPGNVKASGVSDASGHWRAQLPPIATPGGPYTIDVSSADGSLSATLSDVLVGSVFVCGGQSNLSGATTPTSYAFNATPAAAEADALPHVRLFTVGELATQGILPPQPQLGYAPRLPWSVANATVASGFSGVCWMMALNIARTLGPAHPLGFIETAWSGTCIQGWLPQDALASCGPPPQSQGWQSNSTLFNQMVSPFLQFSVAGFGWYQGESNAIYFQEHYYQCALTALFSSWRAAFSSPSAWFGVVQIAPWGGFNTPSAAAAGVRADELASVLGDAHATLASAVDLGDADAPKSSIHPRAKAQVGARLAAGALFDVFGIGAAADTRGPMYARAAPGGGSGLSVTVSFAPPYDAPGSLVLRNVSVWPGVEPSSACPPGPGFLCAGFELQDRGSGLWYPAVATLNADASALVLEAPSAPPGAVANATSNGYATWPQVSLFSAAPSGLPAYPWRWGVMGA